MLESDIEFYERNEEYYGKMARVSLAGSYVAMFAGVMTIANEQTPSALITGAVLAGGSTVLWELKNRSRESQIHCEEQIDKHQSFVEDIDISIDKE